MVKEQLGESLSSRRVQGSMPFRIDAEMFLRAVSEREELQASSLGSFPEAASRQCGPKCIDCRISKENRMKKLPSVTPPSGKKTTPSPHP